MVVINCFLQVLEGVQILSDPDETNAGHAVGAGLP